MASKWLTQAIKYTRAMAARSRSGTNLEQRRTFSCFLEIIYLGAIYRLIKVSDMYKTDIIHITAY